MRLRYLLFALMIVACSGGSQFSGGKKDTGDDTDAESQDATDGDGADAGGDEADVPVLITGAYLTCNEATTDPDAPKAAFACKLASKDDDSKVPLERVANKWKWRAVTPQSGDATVRIVPREKSSEFHVTYVFEGKDRPKVQQFADNTDVVLNMDLKKDVPGVQFFSGKLGKLKANTQKQTVTSDSKFEAPKIDLGDPAQQGKVEQPPPGCTDADKDCIPDAEDICSNTKGGVAIHKTGEWKGCSEGQYKNTDDVDRDGVSNSLDLCANTPQGEPADDVEGSSRRGCSLGQIPEVPDNGDSGGGVTTYGTGGGEDYIIVY